MEETKVLHPASMNWTCTEITCRQIGQLAEGMYFNECQHVLDSKARQLKLWIDQKLANIRHIRMQMETDKNNSES